MPLWNLPPDLPAWVVSLALVLDARNQHRLPVLLAGALFASGRRTVTRWLRAGGVGADFRPYYYFLAALGRRAPDLARRLLVRIALPLVAAGHDRLLFGLDDTPTRRFGPCVEGAGVHHNPTPGPAAPKFVYGHVWVTLAWLAVHPLWGVIALPLLARLYVRRKDVGPLALWYSWRFQTKLALAAELIHWLARWARWLDKPLWLVADGAYAKREVLRAAHALGVTVVSRLRKDAALRSLPLPRPAGRRGRPALYGKQTLSLAKRAGQRRGWQVGVFALYRHVIRKRYKTFLATWRPAGGVIRVVLVREEAGWRAYFSTAAKASVADILGAVAARSSVEQLFHDVKEVWGAGQQQLRNLWANIGAYHLNLWLHTLVELWAWGRSGRRLSARADAPWDDAERRPSPADRRQALQRECLRAEYRAAEQGQGQKGKFRRLVHRLLKLVA
jgi:DDE superfamily endonuclease